MKRGELALWTVRGLLIIVGGMTIFTGITIGTLGRQELPATVGLCLLGTLALPWRKR